MDTVETYTLLLARTNVNEDPNMAAQIAIEVYKEAKAEAEAAAAPWTELAQAAKARVEQVLNLLGTRNLKTNTGQAYWPEDGETVTYDAKKLDVLCADDPALAARLAPHRKVTKRPGAFTIR